MEMPISSEPSQLAKKADLRYVSERSEGFFRQKFGENFKYYNQTGDLIHDSKTLARIDGLVIPPAWEQVWICPSEDGHIQAVGQDSKGRRQYLYHPQWRKISQEAKFDNLVPFCGVLPRIRRRVTKDLKTRGLPKTRVLAAAVWILENTLIRVGNDEYAKENAHYGLTTLRRKHVDFVDEGVQFEFVGKSGVEHTLKVSDPRVVAIVKKCVDIPGYELFRFFGKDKKSDRIDSGDVNDYLQQIAGLDVTAKTFRTWGGTLGAARRLAVRQFEDAKQSLKNVQMVVREVARVLGNTPKICRESYIHPAVISSYQQGILVPHFEKSREQRLSHLSGLRLDEVTVVDLLRRYSS